MKKINILIIILIVIFLIWLVYLSFFWFIEVPGETFIISENEIYWDKLEDVENINIDVNVEDGGTIDVLLMTPEQYGDFTNHLQYQNKWDDYSIIEEASRFNTKTHQTRVSLEKGNYYIVVDNSKTIGTTPTGDITVHIKVTAE